MNEMNEPRRLLAVNLNYLGDVLFTTPALSVLRARFPRAVIDTFVGERAATLLEGNRDVDRIIPRPPRGGLGRNRALRRVLLDGRYDAVLLFQSILASAALAASTTRVPVRVGFAQDGCAFFLTHSVAPRRPGEHVVDAYVRLAEATAEAAFGPQPGTPPPPRLKIALAAEERAWADEFIRASEITRPVAALVIGTSSGRPQKRWPEEYWPLLADRLWNAAGVASVLIGGPEEIEVASRVRAAARSPVASAVGRTSPRQMAALTARCGVVVSGDTGPLHVATAVGTPTVALFGSTDPSETGPWGGGVSANVLYDALACAPCRKSPTCGGRFDCMRALVPERVFDAVLSLLPVSETRRCVLPMAATGVAR